MRRLKRYCRYTRYRVIRWTQRLFTTSNVVLVIFAVMLFLVVLGLQKLEGPYTSGFLNTSPLIKTGGKRREIVVTTARFRPAKQTKPCTNSSKDYNTTSKRTKRHEENSVESKVPLSKKFQKYLPLIKIIYTPKTPRPLHRRVHISSKSTGSVPDIYRYDAHLHERNLTIHRTGRDVHSEVGVQPTYDQWIRLNKDKNNKVFVYSAYFDNRTDTPYIRLIMVMVSKRGPNIYCKLPNGNASTATKKIMNEHWRLKYASYFVSCPMLSKSNPPNDITVSIDVNFEISVTVPVHNNKNDRLSPRGNMAVCVKPLHYFYDRATWMVEFIELHRMLGVDHFYFYNHTVGPTVEKVLLNYMKMGKVTVLPWQLDIKSQKEIRTEAIFASLNDCLFRTMHMFNYAIMLDFDEYIIPRDHDTYQDLIDKLVNDNKQIRGKPGSFVFKNAFFYLYWDNDTTAFRVPPEKPPDMIPYLLTQYKTRRLKDPMKPGSRSKYIVIPDRAVEAGNHVIWKHLSGCRSITAPEEMAILHHYRICEFGGFACLKKPSVIDHTATRFGPALLERVLHQCGSIFQTNDECPISPPLGSPW